MKTNSVITTTITEHDDGNFTIAFNVKGAGQLDLRTAKLDDAIMQRAAIHGLVQRISDAAALSRDPVSGKPASPADKLASMKRLVDHYETGVAEWRLASGEGGGGKSMTIEAIAAIKQVPYEVASDYVERYAKGKFNGDVKKTLAFLRRSESVAAKMAELRAAKPSAIDADEALNELGE